MHGTFAQIQQVRKELAEEIERNGGTSYDFMRFESNSTLKMYEKD
jgi:hypothetical protein